MRQLIVVRHGDYSPSGRLNNWGRIQITALAEKLKSLIRGATVLVFTSPTDRTSQSARIIGTVFGVEIEKFDVLFSDSEHKENYEGALALVKSRQDSVDTLILVTHHEYVEHFPTFFAKRELEISLRSGLIEKGEAWVVDCFNKTIAHLAP